MARQPLHRPHPQPVGWAELPDLADDLDAADVPAEQWHAAALIGELTPVSERRADWAALVTAGTVRKHADVVAAVLAEPPARC